MRMQEKRKKLTEEEKAKIREKQKLQARQRRMCMSAEKKAEAREKDRLTKQMMRKSATDDGLDLREKNRMQKMVYRQNASEEQRALWRERDKLRKREDREVKAVQYRLFDELYAGIESLLVGIPPDNDQNCTTDQGPVQNTVQATTEEPTIKTGTMSDAFNSVQNLITIMQGANVVSDSEITRIHEIIWKTMNTSTGDLNNDVRVYQKAVEDCTAVGDLQECTSLEHQPGPSSLGDTHPAEVMEKAEQRGMKNSDNASHLQNGADVDSSSNVIVKQEGIDCADDIRASAGDQHLADSSNIPHSSANTGAQQQSSTLSEEAAALSEMIQKARWLIAMAEGQDCPEIDLAIKKERMRIRNMLRVLIAPTQDMEKEREIAKLRMALKRQTATPAARELEKEKGRVRMRWKRMTQTEEEREREKEKNRIRTRLKRMEMSADERERIKERERLRKRQKREMATEEQKQAWRENDRISKRIKRGTSQHQLGKLWMEECGENSFGYQQACEEHRECSSSESNDQMSDISRDNVSSDDSSTESVQQRFLQNAEDQTRCPASEEDCNKELVSNILEDVKQGTASQDVPFACTSHETVGKLETGYYDSSELVAPGNQPVERSDQNVEAQTSSAHWDALEYNFMPFAALSND